MPAKIHSVNPLASYQILDKYHVLCLKSMQILSIECKNQAPF